MSRWYVCLIKCLQPCVLLNTEQTSSAFVGRSWGGHKQLHQTVAARLREGSRPKKQLRLVSSFERLTRVDFFSLS